MKNIIARMPIYLWSCPVYFWRWRLCFLFDIRDFWVGIYFNLKVLNILKKADMLQTDVYICLLPFFPIQLRRLSKNAPSP